MNKLQLKKLGQPSQPQRGSPVGGDVLFLGQGIGVSGLFKAIGTMLSAEML